MSDTPYMYLFVRDDLSIPQQIVQTAHAVDEMGKQLDKTDATNFMVLFGIPNATHLWVISEWLDENDIEHHMFYEPDIDEHTAIATRPLKGTERLLMRQFSLKR